MLLLAPVLILWIQISQMNGQQIKHFPEFLLLQEGENFTTYCNSSSILSSLQWYKQSPGGSPVVLMILAKGGEVKTEQRLTGQFGETKQHSSLHLTAAQLSDAGTYFCAGSSYGQNYFGRGTSLTVIPKVKDPNPTVYQLRSPQSSDTSVCLFTDFDSNQVNMEKIMGSEGSTVHKTNSTVLNMEILGSKSNGIVTWGNTSDAGCEYTFNETIPFASSLEISCNAKLVEKSFETDINLNSQNLSVIVFRILLLKVVGFNLLMTLRLWSS